MLVLAIFGAIAAALVWRDTHLYKTNPQYVRDAQYYDQQDWLRS